MLFVARLFSLVFILNAFISHAVFAADCRKVGETAHHMIPNASLKDLPLKLNQFIYGSDQEAARKAATIKIVFLIASNLKNYQWAKAADKISNLRGSVQLLSELPDRSDSNFNMFPMNLVSGPQAECRTDDVHLGNALDSLILSGPYANSPCGNALRDIGSAVLEFLRTSDNKNLDALYESMKKHAQVLFKYGREKQRFSLAMWSYEPESAESDLGSAIKRYRAAKSSDDESKNLKQSHIGVRTSYPLSACWLPIKD